MNNSLIFDSLLGDNNIPFITKWDIPYPYYPVGENFTLPLITGYNYNFYVDWGDGSSIEHFIFGIDDNPIAVHAYLSADVYQVSIQGICERFSTTYFGHPPSESAYLIEIVQWGDISLKLCDSMFDSAVNLVSIPVEDIWTNINDFDRCFYGCTSLTGNVPELWLRDPLPSGTDCFYDCTLVDNYVSIPNLWKGL